MKLINKINKKYKYYLENHIYAQKFNKYKDKKYLLSLNLTLVKLRIIRVKN
jgi:hypothetical protein